MNKKESNSFWDRHFRAPFDKSRHTTTDELFKRFYSLSIIERRVVFALLIIFVISTFWLLSRINEKFFIEIPTHGGSVEEGITGVPRFINPILAISDSDKDMVNLVFAGLLKHDGEKYIPNIAKDVTVSEDGLIFQLELKDDIYWHDGEKVTVDDILFTIDLIKDDRTKSPLKPNWNGVEVSKIGLNSVSFRLPEPYFPFLENLTMGILPKHIWSEINPEEMIFRTENIEAIGAGPYKIVEVKKDSDGIPEFIDLKAWDKYPLGEPYIKNFRVRFFESQEKLVRAYNKENVDLAGALDPLSAIQIENEGGEIISETLPRTFAVFFNQNQNDIFVRSEVRKALDIGVDRDQIITNILFGYGEELNSPLTSSFVGKRNTESFSTSTVNSAREILTNRGWVSGDDGVMIRETEDDTMRLSFKVATANTDELKAVARELKSMWSRIGAEVEIDFFEISDLNQNVIRPRDYEALLFGQVAGRYPDPFVFWHSSQRLDPGLNVAMYTSIDADDIVTELRATLDTKDRNELYGKLSALIEEEVPAVFLYAPHFIYAKNKEIGGVELNSLNTSSERFENVHEWYVHTKQVWNIFVN